VHEVDIAAVVEALGWNANWSEKARFGGGSWRRITVLIRIFQNIKNPGTLSDFRPVTPISNLTNV
jgi:hypothetical protein